MNKIRFNALPSFSFSVLAFCAALSALPITGCNKETPEAKYTRLIKEADTYSSQEKFEEARITLLSALEANPKSADAYYKLAEAQIRVKDFPKAVDNYKTAINLNPDHREARLHLAAIMIAAKENELAESHVRKLLEMNPSDMEARVLSASLEAARNNKPGAKKILEELVKEDPKNAAAIASLGDLALNDDKTKEAEEYFNQALKLEPDNSPIRLALADLYMRQGRLDDAQAILESLLKSEPKNSSLRYHFSEFLLSRGLTDKALSQFEETLKADPDRIDARDRLYDMYLNRNEIEKAKALTTDLGKRKPNDAATEYFLGRNFELDNNLEQAQHHFLKSLEGLAGFAPAFRRAGLLEITQGHRSEGLQHLNQAVSIDEYDVGARLALAKDLFLKRDFAQSREHLKKILEKYPRQIGANVLYADIMLVEGKTKEARGVYELLKESFPNSPIGYFKLALLEEREKNQDAALELYRKTISFDKNIALPAQRLASLLIAKNGLDSAMQEVAALKEKSKLSQPDFDVILGGMFLTKEKLSEEDLTTARGYFNRALEKQPDLLPAYYALAEIDARSGKFKEAAANYEKLVKLQPESVQYRMLLSLNYEHQGEYEKAAASYREILQRTPRFGPASNNLAWILVEHLKGDLEEALKLAQIAKEEMPNESSVSDTLGWIYYKRGAAQAALPLLEEAVDAERKATNNTRVNPEILYHLGVVMGETGNKAGAKKVLTEAQAGAPESFPKRAAIDEALKKLS